MGKHLQVRVDRRSATHELAAPTGEAMRQGTNMAKQTLEAQAVRG